MKASIGHIGIVVSNKEHSFPFYRTLFEKLGFECFRDEEDSLGYGTDDQSIWIHEAESKYNRPFHRKSPGLNHIAFFVENKKGVDEFASFLKTNGIKTLYGSPKTFPEYREDYYAVYFEDPDRIKLEVCFY